MLDVLDALYLSAMIHLNAFIRDEKGAVDLVTVVVLIGIALALAVIFRQRIGNLLNTLFDSIDQNAESVVS